jgi:hypothetical protein
MLNMAESAVSSLNLQFLSLGKIDLTSSVDSRTLGVTTMLYVNEMKYNLAVDHTYVRMVTKEQ